MIFAGVSIGYLIHLGKNTKLECKTQKHKNTRLVGLESTENSDDSTFDWKQFFQLLWADIVSLSLAIVVSVTFIQCVFVFIYLTCN